MSESNHRQSDSGIVEEPLTEDPRPDGLQSAPSLVVLNTGNGKGKVHPRRNDGARPRRRLECCGLPVHQEW